MSRHAFHMPLDDTLDMPKRTPSAFHVEFQIPGDTEWQRLSLPRDCFVASWDDEQFCGELREYLYAKVPADMEPDDLTFRSDSLYAEALRIQQEMRDNPRRW